MRPFLEFTVHGRPKAKSVEGGGSLAAAAVPKKRERGGFRTNIQEKTAEFACGQATKS